MIGRALTFVVVFGMSQLGWQLLSDSPLQHLLIDRGVVAPAAVVARALMPGLGVYALGNRLRDSSGGLKIVNGCDGMETLLLLVAGFAVAPLPVGARIRCALLGIPIVYAANLARILALLYAHHTDMEFFDFLPSQSQRQRGAEVFSDFVDRASELAGPNVAGIHWARVDWRAARPHPLRDRCTSRPAGQLPRGGRS